MSIKRGLVTALTCAVAGSGLLAVSTTSAHAKTTLTNYSFTGWAYGTKISANPLGLEVGKTAYNTIGCTRQAGKNKEVSVASVAPGGDASPIRIDAAKTWMSTYKKNGRVGIRSASEVGKVVIGNDTLGNITIDGLRTNADAYADKNGNLHAESSFTSVDISANLVPVITANPQLEPILGPLQDLLNQVGATVGDLLEQIAQAAGQKIEIPGVAVLKLGVTWNKVTKLNAYSAASALRVYIPGLDGKINTADDVQITVGRGRSDLAKDVPVGLMTGKTHAVDVSLLDGSATLGPLGEKRMHCEGTRGQIKEADLVGLNLLGLDVVDAGVGHNRVFGTFKLNGYRKAWTETSLASVTLGTGDTSLKIDAVVARATAVRRKDGKISLSRKGTQVGGITVAGQSYALPAPGEILEIPGVALIESNVTVRRTRSIEVTALRVTLLDGTAAESVVNIGYARAAILRGSA